jgi:hypothetical protein
VQDADDAAHGAEGDRLGGELGEDGLLGGADGLADADFAGALGDRDQHDVHDADAADHEADAGDGDHEATRPPVSWPQSLVSESGPKISKLSGFHLDLAADAEHLADLFLDERLVLLVVVLDAMYMCP